MLYECIFSFSKKQATRDMGEGGGHIAMTKRSNSQVWLVNGQIIVKYRNPGFEHILYLYFEHRPI